MINSEHHVSPSENNITDDSHVEVISKDVVGKGNGKRINKEVFVADGADDDLNDDLFADAVEPVEERGQAEPQGRSRRSPRTKLRTYSQDGRHRTPDVPRRRRSTST